MRLLLLLVSGQKPEFALSSLAQELRGHRGTESRRCRRLVLHGEREHSEPFHRSCGKARLRSYLISMHGRCRNTWLS